MSNENMSPYRVLASGRLAMAVTNEDAAGADTVTIVGGVTGTFVSNGGTGPSGGSTTIAGPTGPGVEANAVRVTLASNTPVPLIVGTTGVAGSTGSAGANTVRVVGASPATGTTSSVAGSASPVTILVANTARMGATVFNDSASLLYLLLGAGTASATVFTVQMQPYAYYEVPFNFNGILTGLWVSATGSARITEITG